MAILTDEATLFEAIMHLYIINQNFVEKPNIILSSFVSYHE